MLFVTGSKSVFHKTTHSLHEHMVKHTADKGKIELLQVAGCANVLEEKVWAAKILLYTGKPLVCELSSEHDEIPAVANLYQ